MKSLKLKLLAALFVCVVHLQAADNEQEELAAVEKLITTAKTRLGNLETLKTRMERFEACFLMS